MHARTRALATVTALLAAATTVASPAGAESVSRDDRGNDVYTWNTEEDSPPATVSERPVNVAVQQVTVKHSRSAFVVATQLRNLARNGDYFYLNAIVQRGDGTTYSSFVVVEPDDRDGRHVLQTPVGGETVACRGMTHDVDYGRDRIHLSVPRSCLGDPARFRAYGAMVDYPAGSVRGRVHVDQLFSSTSSGATTELLDRG